MARDSRRSTLQTEILAALASGPVDSISALAESLEKARPSVSRSMKKLTQAGLTKKQGRAWCLTSKGQREAELAAKALQRSTKEFVEIAGKKFRAVSGIHERFVRDQLSMGDATPSIAGFAGNPVFDPDSLTLGRMATMVDSLPLNRMLGMNISHFDLSAMSTLAGVADIGTQAEEALSAASGMMNLSESMARVTGINARAEEALGVVTGMGNLVGTVAGLTESEIAASGTVSSLVGDLIDSPDSIAALAGSWQPHDLATLATPILSAQNTYASILETLGVSDYSLSLGAVADQSRLLSSTLSAAMDVADFYSTATSVSAALATAPEAMVIPAHLSAISMSLAGIFEESFESLQHHDHLPISVLSDRLYHSSLPVAHYAEFSRPRKTHSTMRPHQAEPSPRARRNKAPGNEKLDPILYRLNPAFVGKRHGAWLALSGDNPDRFAHAAGSQRNLVSMVLRLLVPEEPQPTETGPGTKFKEKVKQIMRGSKKETAHVVAVANAIYAGYAVFCKYDHEIQTDEHALRAHMQAAEAFLYLMLFRLEENDD